MAATGCCWTGSFTGGWVGGWADLLDGDICDIPP